MGNREAEKQSADARNVAPGPAELRKLVEAATGPDREIDARVALLTDHAVSGWVRHPGWAASDHPPMREYLAGELWPSCEAFLDWRDNNADVECRQAPAYTASLDAVLALVGEKLPGWHWTASTNWLADGGGHCASVFRSPAADLFTGTAPTPALALLSALLAALDDGAPASAKNEATA